MESMTSKSVSIDANELARQMKTIVTTEAPSSSSQRVPAIDLRSLTQEQLRIYGEIGGPRDGQVGGPFAVWLLASPVIADRVNRVSEVLRFRGKLSKQLLEIIILCVARYWQSNFQWSTHAALALRFGLKAEFIERIRLGDDPQFPEEAQQALFDAVTQLLRYKQLPEYSYNRLATLFDFEQLVEVATAVGQYSMAAIVMNAFEIEPANGARPLT
jgi:4-carboxymuconolactone decarboxylase